MKAFRKNNLSLSLRVTEHRTQVILDALREDHIMDWAGEYGEPGYTMPEDGKGILFANWNPVPKWMGNYLEKAGFILEWSDEWYVDYDFLNGKAWRTQPDSYGWESSIQFCDDGILTPDDPVSDWVDEMVNNPTMALPSRIKSDDLMDLGFVRYPDDQTRFENGFHAGMTDDPKSIFKFYKSLQPKHDMLFQIYDVSQFYITFIAWIRDPDSYDPGETT